MAVETTNLAVNDIPSDVLNAECVRTFPTAQFPAFLLLRREEVEQGKTLEHTTRLKVRGGPVNRRVFQDALFD